MQRLLKFATALSLMLIVLCSGTVFAKNNVSEIDIEVVVRDDGSAYIVQEWRGNFSEGTENYIPINTSDISISGFNVSDSNVTYTFEDNWDVDRSLEEKAYKCGIVETSDGVELCFGISEYGANRYAIEYVVEDFIKSYSDYDGTNFMFINPDMSTFPTDGHISIVMQNGTALNENNAGIWAFGYDGYVEFQNGKVNAWTTSALDGNASMIIMLRLDKGIISPLTFVDEPFDSVKDKAFVGSDYDDGELGMYGTILVLAVVFVILLIVRMVVVFLIKRKKAIKKFYNETGYFRDVPNDGKIEMSHYLSQNFDVASEESLIIGALILSMINKKCIEPQTDESIGVFGKVKQSVSLKLVKAPDTQAELNLYNILECSAGEDGILQEKELGKYAYKNPEKIINFVKGAKNNGEAAFISLGGFFKGAGNCIKDLSDKGKEELAEVMGLKKYLDEFTLIAEREITEMVIWKEYLVYATLFGIADKVIEQFGKVYPERLPELEDYNRNVVVAHRYYHSMHRSSQRAMQQRRSSGGGGRSSFGGGGGFSGGGSGGGSR